MWIWWDRNANEAVTVTRNSATVLSRYDIVAYRGCLIGTYCVSISGKEVPGMERNDSVIMERPMGSVKHPLVAFGLAP